MNGEIISIETASKIAALEKENKELKEKLFKAEEAAKRIIDLAYQLDEFDNKKPNECKLNMEELSNGDFVSHCSICGEAFQFMCDGPKENNYNYCSNCGSKVIETIYPDNDEVQ